VGIAPEDMDEVARAVVGHAPGGRSPIQVVSIEVHVEADDEAAFRRRMAAWRLESGIGRTYVEPRMLLHRLVPFLPGLARLLAGRGMGLKLRCAGPHAVDQPALAAAIDAVAAHRVAFKLTQGLHHPVPRPGFPLGFLNALAAVRLRQGLGPDFGLLMPACLAEDDVHAFALRDGIAWRGHAVSAERIAGLPPFAIGSCSLTEPDEDLVAAYGMPAGA
jgi:hypothetical protein